MQADQRWRPPTVCARFKRLYGILLQQVWDELCEWEEREGDTGLQDNGLEAQGGYAKLEEGSRVDDAERSTKPEENHAVAQAPRSPSKLRHSRSWERIAG